ncbi:MAG: hypothetical protein AAEF72_01065 [Gammaproteobacteria bacterium]
MKALLLTALLISIGLTHAASYDSGATSSGTVSAPAVQPAPAPTPKARPTPTPKANPAGNQTKSRSQQTQKVGTTTATQFQSAIQPANTIQTQGSPTESGNTRKAAQPTSSSAITPLNTTLKSMLNQSVSQQSDDDRSVSRENDRQQPSDDKKTQPDDSNNKNDSSSGESNSGDGNNEDNTVKEDDRRQGPGEDKQVSDGENNTDDDNNLLEDLIKRGQLSTATNTQDEEVFYNVMLINTRGCAEESIHQIKKQIFVCNDGELFGPVGSNVGIIGLDTGPVNLDAGPMAAELKALNARNIEKAQAKEKAFQQSFTQDDIKSWTVEDNTFTMIQTTGCDNDQLRLIGGQRFLCRGNEWLGPLAGDGVFSQNAKGVFASDNSFIGEDGFIVEAGYILENGRTTINRLDEQTVAKIKNSIEDEWQLTKQTMLVESIEKYEEIKVTLKDQARGVLYAPDQRNLDSSMRNRLEHEPGLQDTAMAFQQADAAKQFAEGAFGNLGEKNIAVERAQILENYATNVQLIENNYQQLNDVLNNSHADDPTILEASRIFEETTLEEGALQNSMISLLEKKFNDNVTTIDQYRSEDITNADSQYENANQVATQMRENEKNNALSDIEKNTADAKYIKQVAKNWQEHALRVSEIEQVFLLDLSQAKQENDESLLAVILLYEKATDPQFATYLQTAGGLEEIRSAELKRLKEAKNLEIQQAKDVRDQALNAFAISSAVF